MRQILHSSYFTDEKTVSEKLRNLGKTWLKNNTDGHKSGSSVPEPSILANKQYFLPKKRGRGGQGKEKLRRKGNTTKEKNKNTKHKVKRTRHAKARSDLHESAPSVLVSGFLKD